MRILQVEPSDWLVGAGHETPKPTVGCGLAIVGAFLQRGFFCGR